MGLHIILRLLSLVLAVSIVHSPTQARSLHLEEHISSAHPSHELGDLIPEEGVGAAPLDPGNGHILLADTDEDLADQEQNNEPSDSHHEATGSHHSIHNVHHSIRMNDNHSNTIHHLNHAHQLGNRHMANTKEELLAKLGKIQGWSGLQDNTRHKEESSFLNELLDHIYKAYYTIMTDVSKLKAYNLLNNHKCKPCTACRNAMKTYKENAVSDLHRQIVDLSEQYGYNSHEVMNFLRQNKLRVKILMKVMAKLQNAFHMAGHAYRNSHQPY